MCDNIDQIVVETLKKNDDDDLGLGTQEEDWQQQQQKISENSLNVEINW